MQKLTPVLTVIVALAITIATQASAEMMSVSFNGAEIRSAPSVSNSSTIFETPRFYPLNVINHGTEYVEVTDYLGRTGWIHKSLLSKTPSLVIVASKVNIRNGPGTNHDISFHAFRGDSFKLLKKQSDWYQIESAEQKTGWVFGNLTWTP